MKNLKNVTNVLTHELEKSYIQTSLPVLRQINLMKKNWGNEKTMPNYEINDPVYSSIKESCMILDNNKKIHQEVRQEMNTNYRGKLSQMMKESNSQIW
eukprot:CAMPEP_0170554666 /NCGR_PEP_ID=MMETSP0211-20121228/12543_1 /TAXON_ID=311385 /ORGANISM="Pseudokeronopsis sp., Strain OXSARD2" /LENGTH=97 /DNA_ID=CAMNT_0010863921 /DNA_START=170 /DNA_END=460 /DNA_ORIENTATION=-